MRDWESFVLSILCVAATVLLVALVFWIVYHGVIVHHRWGFV